MGRASRLMVVFDTSRKTRAAFGVVLVRKP